MLATSRADGASEWVLPKDKERFEREGAVLLGRADEPSDELVAGGSGGSAPAQQHHPEQK